MTWSVIARDEATGCAGVIVASRFFAVGAAVPHIETGFGAVAGQAFVNPYFGRHGLALLREDKDCEEYPRYDIRIDDHPEPIAELIRLRDVADQRDVRFRRRMPAKIAPARSIAEGYE